MIMKIPVQLQTKEEDTENVYEIYLGLIINSKSNNAHYQRQYNNIDKGRIRMFFMCLFLLKDSIRMMTALVLIFPDPIGKEYTLNIYTSCCVIL